MNPALQAAILKSYQQKGYISAPNAQPKNPYQSSYSAAAQGVSSYKPAQSQILGVAKSRPGSSFTPTPPPATGPTPQQTVESNQDNGNAQIDSDYNQSMSMLNDAESGLRSQAGAATGQIDSGATAAKNEITNTQAVAQQGVNASTQTAERQGKNAIAQARDLYNQQLQQNNSQLSALGISSSSVASALAEKLGVETARRISGVTGSLDEVRQNATNELGRINTYYQGKVSDLQNWVNDQKAVIQNSLIQGINQINGARNQAASAKAQARAGLLQQVQQQLGSLAQQQQQFEQSLQAWQVQKSAALTPIAQDPNYVQNLLAQTQNINQNYAPEGFVATPSFNVDKTGNYTGQINVQKKPDETQDPLTALYAQAGV